MCALLSYRVTKRLTLNIKGAKYEPNKLDTIFVVNAILKSSKILQLICMAMH